MKEEVSSKREVLLMNKTKVKFIILIFISLLMLIPADNIFAFENNAAYEYKFSNNFKKDYSHLELQNNFLIENNVLKLYSPLRRFAIINQSGSFNESSISQIKNIGSLVELVQIGNNNNVEVKQTANFAKTEVFQFGSNLKLSVNHWKSDSEVYIIQSGTNEYNKRTKIYTVE
jgi:hypothetical protein